VENFVMIVSGVFAQPRMSA